MTQNLWDAARSGDLKRVEHFFETTNDGIDVRDKDGNTPLRHAAYAGHLEVTKYLIAKKADINAKDQFGFAPLHLAAEKGHREIVTLLLDNGADVNITGGGAEYTPLHIVALQGNLEIVQILVEHGADVNAIGSNGNQPLHIACKEGYIEIIKYLLEKGAEINAKDKIDATPLHWAYFAKVYRKMNNDLFNLLVSKGAIRTSKDKEGHAPSQYEQAGRAQYKITIEAVE